MKDSTNDMLSDTSMDALNRNDSRWSV